LTPTIVNGTPFGFLIQAQLPAGSGGVTFSANSFSFTIFYVLGATSQLLKVKSFGFSLPSTDGVSGIQSTFQAYSSVAGGIIELQLLKNGVAVGSTKSATLTTTPTIYSVGDASDLWDTTWLYSDINNTQWGVQVTAAGSGTIFINDLDTLVYLTPALANYNYVKSFVQNNGQTYTLALDADGTLWKEDVTNLPTVLSVAQTGFLPGSFAKSSTAEDQEWITFSNLSVGTDRPRVFTGEQFHPLSQVGPGAPPHFVSSVGTSGGTVLTLTNFQITSNVVTFDYTGTQPIAGQVYRISGASPSYLNGTRTVLGTGLSPTQFEMELTHANVVSTPLTAGIATLQYSYNVANIIQYPATSSWEDVLWSAGPGLTTPGNVLTIYYSRFVIDGILVGQFTSGADTYVYITGAPFGFQGTFKVTGVGQAVPPGGAFQRYYLTVNVAPNGYGHTGGSSPPGSYQNTMAYMTMSTPVPDLATGQLFSLFSVTPSAWNGTWPVVDSLKSGVLNITNTQMSAAGVATYQYNVQSGVAPVVNNIIEIQNCTNDPVFNTIGVVATATGSQFTISGFAVTAAIASAHEAQAQAQTFGNQFTFDPGAKYVGTTTNPIPGNGSGGTMSIIGSPTSVVPIGSGTRQGVVFFITDSGYETAPSPPVVFTTSSDANFINAANIPIGPPNTVARGIAFTEAGQNGVPGANFYVIDTPVTETIGSVTTTYTSTIIRNNTQTSAKFTFTDAILLASRPVDVQGANLFNQIELGSCAWCVPYANRMFYGLQLNKVDNFNNLSFDGGYLPNPGGNKQPLGWRLDAGSTASAQLLVSPVTGMALRIYNDSGSTLVNAGRMNQTAYVDSYNVPIIKPNTRYSIRVACRAPSSVPVGTLTLSLRDYNLSLGYGVTYGSFTVPLSSMSTNTQVFSGTLLTSPFVNTVSPNLALTLSVLNLGNGADCEIDRIEVYETATPYLLAQVFGSYINKLEAIDASSTGGIIDTTSENPQACMGAFVMHDNLYLLKKQSMYSTEDNPQSEPGGWGLREVSNKVGTIGINAYDTGEEWAVTACRAGIYGFNGGQPVKIMQELWNLWDLINWNAGNTIVLRNDITNKRIYCAVPLPTPNKWLPNTAVNMAPTSPNVMLMLNYQGMADFNELVSGAQVHTTMFGTLAAVDMRRKWSIWQIPSPYMDFITREDNESHPLFVCNGIDSGKIYEFSADQLSDDGQPINSLYTTYGFVNAAKAATLPIFGFHTKRYTVLQTAVRGAGTASIRILPNTLSARYPYSVPVGIRLSDPVQDDYFRPINVKGNRAFIEFSTNAVDSWFLLEKLLLTGRADPWSTLNPTGGGNLGVMSS
jgi:hypothetical protein